MTMRFDSSSQIIKKLPCGQRMSRLRLLGGVSVLALSVFAAPSRVRAASTGLFINYNASTITVSGGVISGEYNGIVPFDDTIGTFTTNALVTGSLQGGFLPEDATIGTFNNTGTIYGYSEGAFLSGETVVENSGSISGKTYGILGAGIKSLTNTGIVTANSSALYVGRVINTISNSGTLSADFGLSTNNDVGTVTNTKAGLIKGGKYGILAWRSSSYNNASVNVISNSGTITGGKAGIYNEQVIGTLENEAGGTITATQGTGGIVNSSEIVSLTNSGTIIGEKAGVYNSGTIGSLVNNANGTITAAQGSNGVYNSGIITNLSNSGTISGEVQGLYNSALIGTLINNGGATITGGNGAYGVLNAATVGPLTNAGLIIGAKTGLYNSGTIGTLANSGTISGSINGVFNLGTINGLSNTNVITSLDNEGKINGAHSGLFNNRQIGAVTNSGTISGTSTGLFDSSSISTLTNSGHINGDAYGVLSQSGSIGSLTNSGTISSSNTISGIGIDNNNGSIASLNNTGVISGGETGIYNTGNIGLLTNSGVISGSDYAIQSQGSFGPIVNAGKISGNISLQVGEYAPGEYFASIAGASSNALGTLTGGNITIGNSATGGNLTFDGESYILLADNITVGGGLGTVTNYATITLDTPQTITGVYVQEPSGVVLYGANGHLYLDNSTTTTTTTSPTSPAAPAAPAAPPDPPIFVVANRGDLSPTGSDVLMDATGPVDYAGYKANGIGYDVTLSSVLASNGHYELVANLVPTNFNLSTSYNLVLAGLDGSRSLSQSGSGSTVLIGAIGYTGATTVTGGTLDVVGTAASSSYTVTGGTLRADGTLSGVVTVSDGGTLAGSGAFGGGTIASGGVVAPANLITTVPSGALAEANASAGIGSLTSNGTLSFTKGSIYQVEADAAGQSDQIVVNGKALLSGGTVQVLAGEGSYAQKSQYTILTATDGVSGAFTGVLSDLAFLTPTLSYDPGDVYLTLRRNDVDYTSLAQTGNEYAVAAALQGAYFKPLAAAGGSILDSVNGLGTAQAPAAFNALSGAGITGAQTAAYGAVNLTVDAVNGQEIYWLMGKPHDASPVVGVNMASDADAPARDGGPRSWRSWAAPLGGSTTLNGGSDVGSTAVTAQAGGGAAGIDYEVNRNVLVGVTAGGATDSYSASNLSTSGTMTGGDVGLYGVARWAGFYASGLLSFADFSGQSTRTVSGLGSVDHETGDLSVDAYTGRIELGYRASTSIVNLTPFVAFQATSLQQSGFTESSTESSGQSGALGLAVQSASGLSEPGSIGLQFDRALVTRSGWTVSPVLRLSWVHDFQTSRSITAELAGLPGNPWTVYGASGAANAADVSLSLQGTNRRGLSLFAAVEAEPSSQGSAYRGQLGLKYLW
jgi:uncharacterized protein with beta-barrel porin domain